MNPDGSGLDIFFDEVDMEDLINTWKESYADGVTLDTWYYDPHKQTVILKLYVETDEPED